MVNGWSREEIRRILFEYGEERYAPLIAAAIERERADKPIETTLELVRVIKGAMPAKALREKQHPAKRSFQAIRIAVNDELGAVREAMEKAIDCLNPGGRLAVITFHSLEEPHRQGGFSSGGTGLHLSEGLSGMHLRQKAEGSADAAQADSAGRKGN